MIELFPSHILMPAAAFFVAAASPGPATLAVAGAAMSSGVRPALWLSAGLALGLAGWGVLVALGLGPLVVASAPAQWALRIGGGLFLLYLSWGSARSALSGQPVRMEAAAAVSPVRMFLRGALLNGLNPKAGLAWAAVIAMGGAANTGAIWGVVGVCAAMGLAIYAVYAALFAVSGIRRAYQRARRWVDGVVAIGFGAAGGALLTGRG